MVTSLATAFQRLKLAPLGAHCLKHAPDPQPLGKGWKKADPVRCSFCRDGGTTVQALAFPGALSIRTARARDQQAGGLAGLGSLQEQNTRCLWAQRRWPGVARALMVGLGEDSPGTAGNEPAERWRAPPTLPAGARAAGVGARRRGRNPSYFLCAPRYAAGSPPSMRARPRHQLTAICPGHAVQLRIPASRSLVPGPRNRPFQQPETCTAVPARTCSGPAWKSRADIAPTRVPCIWV